MNNVDSEYFRLLNLVLEKGRIKKNRTGIDTIGIFGAQARFNLQDGFPLLTTKKIFTKAVIHELLWFLRGETNIKYLQENGVTIWNEWADKDGELGQGTYGGMWRAFPTGEHTPGGMGNPEDPIVVDQIQKVINKLKSNPDDRRLIVSAWHPYWVDHCALPPFHVLFQFHTEELTAQEQAAWLGARANTLREQTGKYIPQLIKEGYLKLPTRRLNCQLYQRSCDLFLGVPFNIASYALLTEMVAQVSGMVAGEFIHTYGDLHIYTNHLTQVKEQLSRKPFDILPKLVLNKVDNLFDFKYEDIKIEGYQCHSAIKAEVAV